jgi:hypothetical protein
MGLLPLIPLVQVAGLLATRRRLSQWRRDPAGRPLSGRMWGRHLLLPLIPNLTLAAILTYLRSSGLIRFMDLFMPDLAWTAWMSGGLAGVWALPRTGLMLRSLRRPGR